MAVGNVTNLGIGTKNSGLNDDLIKKLKEADVSTLETLLKVFLPYKILNLMTISYYWT